MKSLSLSFNNNQLGLNVFHRYSYLLPLSFTPGYVNARLKDRIISAMNILVCISKTEVFRKHTTIPLLYLKKKKKKE